MLPPAPDEVYALWAAGWPEHLPGRPGFLARWQSTDELTDELTWRRDAAGELVGLAVGRRPETHPYGYVRLLLVRPDVQRRGLGRELVTELRERLGHVPLAVGEERGHFVPGVTTSSLPFWLKVGFHPTGARCVDMACDLRGPLPRPEWPSGLKVVTGEVPGVLNSALQLTETVFSPRWTADVQAVAEVAPHQVLTLVNAGQVMGFALTGREGDPCVLPSFLYPAALRDKVTGAQVVGGLGPIGLHPDWRGRGLGRAFMLACMTHLQVRGVQVMGIDWTGIAPFYEKLGFRTWETTLTCAAEQVIRIPIEQLWNNGEIRPAGLVKLRSREGTKSAGRREVIELAISQFDNGTNEMFFRAFEKAECILLSFYPSGTGEFDDVAGNNTNCGYIA